ncbi:putative metal-binding motif-containing protein [Thermodesulfobacteriota bacterium]
MKYGKRIKTVIISLVLFWVMLPGILIAGTPPSIDVTLDFDRSTYLLDDAIMATITLTNLGSDVIITDGFKARDFHLMLRFTGSTGNVITKNTDQGSGEPLGPPIYYDGDTPVQAEKVEIVEAGWTYSTTFNVRDYYTLNKADTYTVKVVIPARTFSAISHTSANGNFADLDGVYWWGIVESSEGTLSSVADADDDTYSYPLVDSRISAHTKPDCNDNNPGINPGASEVAGNGIDDDCNPATTDDIAQGSIVLHAAKHTVGPGSHPGSAKEPLQDLSVRLYDRSNDSCVKNIGTSWQKYKVVWQSCDSVPYGFGSTDNTGNISFNIDPGFYIALGRYETEAGKEIFIGRNMEEILPNGVVEEYLQVIIKADGKNVPGKYNLKKGSQLLIIEPEFVEWSGTQELYPFVFDSIGDWEITTSVTPPEGFEADYKSLSEEVDNEVEAVQFIITDIGSKWVATEVVHKIKHAGKTEKVMSKIGIKCSKKLAKEKNFDKYCNQLD